MIMLIALFGIAHSDIEESSYTKPHNFGMVLGMDSPLLYFLTNTPIPTLSDKHQPQI